MLNPEEFSKTKDSIFSIMKSESLNGKRGQIMFAISEAIETIYTEPSITYNDACEIIDQIRAIQQEFSPRKRIFSITRQRRIT